MGAHKYSRVVGMLWIISFIDSYHLLYWQPRTDESGVNSCEKDDLNPSALYQALLLYKLKECRGFEGTELKSLEENEGSFMETRGKGTMEQLGKWINHFKLSVINSWGLTGSSCMNFSSYKPLILRNLCPLFTILQILCGFWSERQDETLPNFFGYSCATLLHICPRISTLWYVQASWVSMAHVSRLRALVRK